MRSSRSVTALPLAEQDAGVCVFHVIVDDEETIVGTFNLRNLVDGTAEVGYRVAQRASGRGVTTLWFEEAVPDCRGGVRAADATGGDQQREYRFSAGACEGPVRCHWTS